MRQLSTNFPWTEDQIATLRAGHAAGLTGRQIAAKLGGGVTRNAVIGKLLRLGLRLLQRHGGRPDGSGDRQPRARNGYNYRDAPWKPKIIEQFPPVEATDLPPEPVANPVTLMQLTEATCHWPCSGEGASTMFCGAVPVEGYPYCAGHCSVAYAGPVKTTPAERAVLLQHMRKMRKAKAA